MQHTAQYLGGGDAAHPAGLGYLVGDDAAVSAAHPLHGGGGAVQPAVCQNVGHGGNLQRRCGQCPLPEAEQRKVARVLQLRGAGQRGGIALQPGRKRDALPQAESLGSRCQPLGAQFLPQFNKVAVAALRQRRAQVDLAVGAALGAAVGLPVYRDAARAVRGEPVQPGVVGGGCRHDLKHRPHAKGGQQTVDQRGVVRRNALGNIVGVIPGYADGGKDLAGVGLQHHDAAAGHMQVGDPLAQALDVGIQGQRYPLPRAGMPGDEHRLAARERQPLRGGGAGGNDLVPGCREQRIVGALQPRNALPLAVAVAQKMHRNGQRQIPLCDAAARDAQRGYIPIHRHKK